MEILSSHHRQRLVPIKAGPYSAAVAVCYFIVATIYIHVSSSIAGESARSLSELANFEILKGTLFVVFTAVAMFIFNFVLFSKLRKQQLDILRHEQNRHTSEQVLLAGTFAGAIAHDINNALTVATIATEELAGRDDLLPEHRELVGEIGSAMGSISDWNRRLFELGGRRLLGAAHEIDLAALADDCIVLARRHQLVRGCRIELKCEYRPFLINGTESIIRRALLNLILNAAGATGSKGQIEIKIEHESRDYVEISVSDDGPGVPESIQNLIFEPFFTTKSDGNGLGLTSVVACAQAHSGEAYVSKSQLGGARFAFTLRVGNGNP